MADATPRPPSWVTKPRLKSGEPGIPTLLCSDWHWGEVVDPAQIQGVNEFNLDIARRRLRKLIENALDLLFRHTVGYSGESLILPLGGDMVSGNIHEELVATNEVEIMPCVLDLRDSLVWAIRELRKHVGKILIVGVRGNHGRNTKKMWAKASCFTSFDWLLYQMLARAFDGDKGVTFIIPSGPDAFYPVAGWRYVLSHGDTLGKGGDGMIGALGPIVRGDHKKRSRNAQIRLAYDTLVIGHYHQLKMMRRIVVNGSLIGYTEYANQWNLEFEPPQQALWFTHPEYGPTISMPVFL